MDWNEAMKGNATAAFRDHVGDPGGIFSDAQQASWDPFEVWLTRIKQPRERADKLALAKVRRRGAE